MPDKNDKAVAVYPTGYDHTKKLIEQTGKNELLASLMKIIDTLVEDPIIRKTLEDVAVTGHNRKAN